MKQWGDSLKLELENFVQCNEEQLLHGIAAKAVCVESLGNLLDEFCICPQLKEEAMAFGKLIVREVAE
eukprot:8121353-Ditylum_brightwellii.AAC.1